MFAAGFDKMLIERELCMIDRALRRYAADRIADDAPCHCKVCSGATRLHDVLDFARHGEATPHLRGVAGIPIYYEKCDACDFVFTRFFDRFTPEQWRQYVYNAEYDEIDPDYLAKRPIRSAAFMRLALAGIWRAGDRGCDYGGGNGLFARLVGEHGFAFDTVDPYGMNNAGSETRTYPVITAFEVLEHVADPMATFKTLSELAAPDRSMIVASTFAFDPAIGPGRLSNWWYAAPRNGHVSLYAPKTFAHLARTHAFDYLAVTSKLHLFGRGVDLAAFRRRVLIAKTMERLERPFRSRKALSGAGITHAAKTSTSN